MDAKMCLSCPHAPKKAKKWCAYFDEMPKVPLCPRHPGVLAHMKRCAEIAAAVVLDNDATGKAGVVVTSHLDAMGVKRDDPQLIEVCYALKQLLESHVDPHQAFSHEIETVSALVRPAPKKVGPNDPCPCGSGKKYKKCCANEKPPAN